MKLRSRHWVLVAAACIVVLDIAGSFLPASMTWGFHFLGFLSPAHRITYLVLLAVLIPLLSRKQPGVFPVVASFASNKPRTFLALCSAAFTGAALIFHQRVYLLGDGFVFLKNFENTFLGIHPLLLGNSPLSAYYFYLLMKLFGAHAFPGIMVPISAGEIVLGIGFLVTAFVTVSTIWSDQSTRLLAFLFLSSMPYMQLFFGYPETYPVVLCCISLFVMTSVLYLRGRLRFEFVLPAFVILLYSHYLTACLALSPLFLTMHELRSGRWKRTGIGVGAAAAMVLLMTFAPGHLITDVVSSSSGRSHLLSFATDADAFQAYTMLSPLHAVDLTNSIILEACVVFLLLGMALSPLRKRLFASPLNTFFSLAVVPFLLMLLVLKFDLGMARDWDVVAPYVVPCCLLVLMLLVEEGIPRRVLAFLIGATMLHSLTWFSFNATTSPGIARATVLMDRRLLSYEGAYEASFHLSMAYELAGDTASSIGLWESYLSNNPGDIRAYPQLINGLVQTHTTPPARIMQLYDEWRARDPDSERVKFNYSQFCLDAGEFFYQHEAFDQAEQLYRKMLELFPTSPVAHNNLGTVYEKRRDFNRAISSYAAAIACDSGYFDGYWNLGRLLYRLGKKDDSLEVTKLAARHGDTSAQKELASRGLSW